MRHGVWTIAAAVLLGGCSCNNDKEPDDKTGTTEPRCYELSDGRCVEETYADPTVLEPDADGVYQLALEPTEVTLAGQRHCVRAYNGVYPGPTIDTPARDGAARSVRVDMVNKLEDHAWNSLEGSACTCTNSSGQSCAPEHVHNGCASEEDRDCTCVDEDGEDCVHMFDFNVTNLHAHGSHVRPDYARGGEPCESTGIDGYYYACRECGDDVCDGDASDDTCFHGDNVLNAVHPQEGARYRWDIDEDDTHHSGLQWYHPHIHGTTAIQVASGAAGAWIVRGEMDSMPGIVDARERVMVFNTPPIGGDGGFEPLADGEACTQETITFDSFETLGDFTASQMNLLNDQYQPRMIAAPGQVELWRILHAGFLDEVYLGMFRGDDLDCSSFSTDDADTMQLTQIGRDGLLLPQSFEHPYLFMSPGYRIEAVVGGDGVLEDGDTWCMVAARFLQDGSAEPGDFLGQARAPQEPITAEDILARFDSDGVLVATLNVTADAGPATTTTRPDFAAIAATGKSLELGGVDIETRCAEAAAEVDPEEIDQVAVLQVGFWTVDDPDPCDCSPYNVNCNNFEQTDRSLYPVDRDLPLGAVEHWRVAASVDGHPFHIHINPYVVCPVDNPWDPMPFPHWRDTFLVNLDRQIDIITENKSYTGPFVFHCHKLTHEDHGMMEVIRVCDPATDPTCGAYDWRACDPDDLACFEALAATDCALNAVNDIDAAACVTELGGPMGVCGANGCTDDGTCGLGAICEEHVCQPGCRGDGDCALADRCDVDTCVPAPCSALCGPGQTCEHGVCL